jgi:hypothetical protein
MLICIRVAVLITGSLTFLGLFNCAGQSDVRPHGLAAKVWAWSLRGVVGIQPSPYANCVIWDQ